MCKTVIQTEEQYEWAMGRIEELLPLVDDSTPTSAPEYIELDLLTDMVADYSDEHYSLGEPTLDEMLLGMDDLDLTDKGKAVLLGISEEQVRQLFPRQQRPASQVPVGRPMNTHASVAV